MYTYLDICEYLSAIPVEKDLIRIIFRDGKRAARARSSKNKRLRPKKFFELVTLL